MSEPWAIDNPDDPFEQALAIMRDKGDGIMLADLRRIEALGLSDELLGWVYEGLFLTVNVCTYQGDIPPFD